MEIELNNQSLEQQKILAEIVKLEQHTANLLPNKDIIDDGTEDIPTLTSKIQKLVVEANGLQTTISRLTQMGLEQPRRIDSEVQDSSTLIGSFLNSYMDKISQLEWRLSIVENELREKGI